MTTQTANKEIRKALTSRRAPWSSEDSPTIEAIRKYMKILGPEMIAERFAGWDVDSAVEFLANDVRSLPGFRLQ